MAVIVQELVPAFKAGVIHTRHERKKMVVEAVRGEGRHVVDADTKEKETTIISREDIRLRGKDWPLERSGVAVLTKDQLRQLTSSAFSAEAKIGDGTPLDIEYVINRQGKIVFVQARPLRDL